MANWPVHDGNINNHRIQEKLKVLSQNVGSKNLEVGEEVAYNNLSIVMGAVAQNDSNGLFVVWHNSIAKVNVLPIDFFEAIYAKGLHG